MTHTLPELPFSPDAIAPWCTAETFSYHHGKHHAAYVKNLNGLIEGTPNADKSLEDIIKSSEGGLFNNAAQHFNHSFFWNCLRPASEGGPSAELAAAIDGAFGSMEKFCEAFAGKAATLFGSGWAFLVKKADGSLDIIQYGNAACPITDGHTPLLTLDVWEHAYYIDHRNARPAYIKGFWQHANWDFASKNFAG